MVLTDIDPVGMTMCNIWKGVGVDIRGIMVADKLEAEDKERRANADKELNVMKLDTGDLNELEK
jgi:hypothetical protein